MNSLKTLFVVALLAAVGYGVYTSLHTNGTSMEPPAGTPQYLTGPPSISLQGNGVQPQPGIPAVPAASPTPQFNRPNSTTSQLLPPKSNTQPNTPSAQNRSGVMRASAEKVDPLSMRSDNMSNFGSSASGRPLAAPKSEFEVFMAIVDEKLAAGKLADAHLSLSPWHNDPRLSPQEARHVEELLDKLAGSVIYSQKHLLERPYEVKSGDTLQRITGLYKVPWQVLAKINGISDPNNLQPGQKLKVIYGPFDAIITMHKHELKLTIQGRYAGRFRIGVGRDHEKLKGAFMVRSKTVNPTYYGPNQTVIDADDPNNPLGERWIALDHQLGIHGTNNPQSIGSTNSKGCISLSEQDVEDVFDILSIGSRVVIRR